jgi:S1-C subfamily serine protease
VEVTAFDSKNHSISKTGSGFILNSSGIPSIVTSSNLASGNKNITVTLSDGSSYDTKLIAYDPITTIAVLSIEGIPQSKFSPLPLVNSTHLKVGQIVTAIGDTMGFSNLFTDGMISGLEKSIPTFAQNTSSSLTKIPNGIVTTLNLGPGYGGSPLFNTEGQIAGMNIENYSSGQSKNTGISFAIPSNSLSKIIPALLSKGYYLHPWLGASGTDVTPDIAKALNLTESKGFLVITAENQSPAKKAGILGGDNKTSINGRMITLGGDIIQKADNKDIQNIHELLSYIENEKNVGDSMIVTVLRNGLLQSINVKLEANPNVLSTLK